MADKKRNIKRSNITRLVLGLVILILVNIISSIENENVAIIFVEQNAEKTKVSWRALNPKFDVSQVAKEFKGGGHKAAAGAEMSGSLAEVKERILQATRKMMEKYQS